MSETTNNEAPIKRLSLDEIRAHVHEAITSRERATNSTDELANKIAGRIIALLDVDDLPNHVRKEVMDCQDKVAELKTDLANELTRVKTFLSLLEDDTMQYPEVASLLALELRGETAADAQVATRLRYVEATIKFIELSIALNKYNTEPKPDSNSDTVVVHEIAENSAQTQQPTTYKKAIESVANISHVYTLMNKANSLTFGFKEYAKDFSYHHIKKYMKKNNIDDPNDPRCKAFFDTQVIKHMRFIRKKRNEMIKLGANYGIELGKEADPNQQMAEEDLWALSQGLQLQVAHIEEYILGFICGVGDGKILKLRKKGTKSPSAEPSTIVIDKIEY